MSNYIEHNDRMAFHPGYFIQEIVEEYGLTQNDFAKRLDTTPKNLSKLIRGEQNLSADIAMKLSKMLGTSVEYWLNLQNKYDTFITEIHEESKMKEEIKVLNELGYKYFADNFRLEKHSRNKKAQVKELRHFLKISALSLLKKEDLAISFRNEKTNITNSNIVKANAMVQIAVNKMLKSEIPKYDKNKLQEAEEYALTLTEKHNDFYPLLYKKLFEAGVFFEVLPNISGSKTNGATKRVKGSVLLMVNNRRLYSDSFWFTLFHEIAHIKFKDFGISFDDDKKSCEDAADKYAEDKLIPPNKYLEFVKNKVFDSHSIRKFAKEVGRDPGIILGRLQKDKLVGYQDSSLSSLKKKYRVKVSHR